MCKKLFVLALVLGLVSNALGWPVWWYDCLIYYSMDQWDSVGGYQHNGGSLGSIGDGEETFLAANNGYAPGILGDAVILTLDGALNPGGYDPNSAPWVPPNEEAGNIIDITPEAESLELDMKPFENKTISLWFMQTAQRDPALYHPGNDGTQYLLGSYFTYATYIAFRPGAEEGDPDVLGFRAGASQSTTGPAGISDWVTAPIAMNVWNHAAMVLKNVEGEIGYNMQASFYLNGVLLASIDGLCRASDAYRWGGLRPWNLAAIGGYQWDEAMTTGHCTGALIDEFAIIDGALSAQQIQDIYTSLAGEPNYVELTVNVEPNDIGIDTVTPDVGEHIYWENMLVIVNAETSVNCPDIYHFDHWEGDVADPNSARTTITMSTDKVITAVFAAGQRECGDDCHPILKGDLNGDCYINFDDFALYTDNWLSCTHPDCD